MSEPAGRQPPLLELARVHGVDAQGPDGAPVGRLRGVTLSFDAGVHVFVGQPEDGTVALCELCSGRRRPRVGAVTVRGREPSRSPRLRRRMGALLPSAALPAAATVGASLALVGLLRGIDWHAALEAVGLSCLASRRPSSLRMEEARAIELALLLALPEPLVLALYEPLSRVADMDLDAVRRAIAQHGHDGACIVIASSSPAEVESLAHHVLLLRQGQILAGDELIGWPGHEQRELSLLVDATSEQLRAFAAALGRRQELSGIAWEESARGPALVRLQGADVDAAALALAEVVATCDVRVVALQPRTCSFRDMHEALHANRAQPHVGAGGHPQGSR